MGETLRNCHFTDRWWIRRGGRLVHAEALTLAHDVPALLAAAAGAGGAQMAATLVYVGPRIDEVQADHRCGGADTCIEGGSVGMAGAPRAAPSRARDDARQGGHHPNSEFHARPAGAARLAIMR